MSTALLRPPDDDVIRTLFWLGVLLLPVIGRALKALREKAEKAGGGAGGDRASRREAQRKLEEEGGDLWRRLARGEQPERPAMAEARRAIQARRSAKAPEAPVVVAKRAVAEDLEVPRPLSVLGEVSEPGEASETSLETASLETEAQPVPLDALGAKLVGATAAPRRRLPVGRADLRRAVVMSEILATPVGLRAPEARW